MIQVTRNIQQKYIVIFFFCATACVTRSVAYDEQVESQDNAYASMRDTSQEQDSDNQNEREETSDVSVPRIINAIEVIGNKNVDREAILSYVPFKKGKFLIQQKHIS